MSEGECPSPITRSEAYGSFTVWAGDPDGNKLRLDSFGESSQRGNGAFVEDEVRRKGEVIRQDSRGAIGESGRPYRYDVFLSFRGEDTRNGFTGHLHAALDQRGIDAFLDEEDLWQGEEIAPAILGAIGESRISIVVFSENYASSSWCLDELVRIVECRDKMGQMVCPVFYKVDPSDVRKHRGRYGQALIDHEERLKSNSSDPEKVKRWREALTAAANISGWHLVDERESYVIKNIVKRVCAQLKNRKKLSVPENVVAMDSHVHRMRTLLDMESNEVRMVGIYGSGGIGKTTIARATYNAFEHKFEYCCFLSNVRETCEQNAHSGLLQLQEALIHEERWDDCLKLHNVDEGMSMTKSRLCKKKVLIVLDDVNQPIQLETLVGRHDWFGCGSRIIITTRDERLLAAHGIKSMYKVQPLDRLTARTLFRTIVFSNSSSCPDHEELSYDIVEYTKGLPLAVKVLGSFLRGKKLPVWKSTLDKLKEVFNGDIFSVLRMSFDGLDDYEKDIFLDIACFFKGESESYVRDILESCDLYPDAGINVLLEKSLVTIECGKLEMHDMIQEMGREIVRRESPKEPGERSRLWSYKDVLHVLTEGTGTNKVEAIMIKLATPEEVRISAQAFTNMRRLRIFLARNVYYTGNPVYFPTNLRWLEWPDYYPTSAPFNTDHRKLVGLDLSKSSMCILGKTFKLCRNLKSVNFSHCALLTEIPDVSSLPSLERLDLGECTNLVEVHQSLGHLDKLVYLNFLNCCNLSRFPRNLKLRSLQNLILRGCSKLSRFPDILVQMKHLTELALHGTAIRELPSSITNLVELKGLYLEDCMDLKNLPCSIYTLQHLERILADGCSQLSKLPECLCESSDCTNFSLPLALPSVINLNVQRCSLSELGFLKNLHCMSSLTILDLSENKFVSLPTCISQFTKLQQLFLMHCKQLQEILALPPNITSLHAKGCELLETCADLSNVLPYNSDESPWLRRIDFSSCHKLIQNQCSSNCKMLSIEGLLGETRVDVFHPGSKIPTWFVHQSIKGLIKFHVSSDLYCDIAGLAFCAIIGSTNRKEANISCEMQLFVNKEETYGCVDCFSSLELDHVWVLYVPRRMMWGLDAKLVNRRSQFAVLFQASEGTLRSCGVHLVYKQGKQPNDMKIDESIDPQNSNANLTSSYVETRKMKERFSDS
ncbi:TMV resistance protein N isoform X2 [Eucalyptus grandis]|uniref:TMV resistance protein N isoform X2 n=1 Tax=Eucalyptus grandis TaxID=71139 RepID=UPI00192EADCC|nr:TMV resistance protein N isoform X2 [Eucalyptus grandis]